MEFLVADFNGADEVFSRGCAGEWRDLEKILESLPLYLQPSDQAGKVGVPIFDPKGTNEHLTAAARRAGWRNIPVPEELTPFGIDWDAGKGRVLAEWQFSNYPFLWNNVIRSEAVYRGSVSLSGLGAIAGMLVVTKCGLFPSSNSTLYFEQARAQLEAVMQFGTFSIPLRLIGLTLNNNARIVRAVWSTYGGRYHRGVGERKEREFKVGWGRVSKYGTRSASFIE